MEAPRDDNHPLPLMGGAEEVKRSVDYTPRLRAYRLRFTPAEIDDETSQVYGFDEILREFIEENQFDIYVLVQETKPYIHYHLYLETELSHEKLKKLVRAFVHPFYPNKPPGFGNKQSSCLLSDDPLKAIIYLLKQAGRQEWSGFTEDFINTCRMMSYEKKDNEFEKEMAILADKFMSDLSYCPIRFGSEIAILHSQYDKRVHWRDIQGYVNSKFIKRDPSQAYLLASKFLTF